jgi:DNA polymerase-4
VWELVRGRVARVEQVGIDEGYLDLSHVGSDAARARAVLAALQSELLDRTGLDASLGAAATRTAAKVASDFDKPRGLTVVPPGGCAAFLAPLELRVLPGIGPRSEERLARAGLRTIGDLAALDDERLALLAPGKVGRELRDRARGLDPRGVDPEPTAPVSQGSEETFERDLASLADLEAWLVRLASEVWSRLDAKGLVARAATTKLRYADFQTVTRSQTLRDPIASEDDLVRLARLLLHRALEERADPVRLLGVYASALSDAAGEAQLRLPVEA